MRLYEVGGAIRDEILGLPTKDVDFACEAASYDDMRDYLVRTGYRIFLETPEFLTIRAAPPPGSRLAERTNGADFVLCRKDSPGSDGRRPDYVEPGSIYDDLARRDFTVNAMAREVVPDSGRLIDPFGGAADLEARVLRFVGDPYTRIEEDGLRVLRAFRFWITKGLHLQATTAGACFSVRAARVLAPISVERKREELRRMFAHNTLGSLRLIGSLPGYLQEAMFPDRLWLDPSLRTPRGVR